MSDGPLVNSKVADYMKIDSKDNIASNLYYSKKKHEKEEKESSKSFMYNNVANSNHNVAKKDVVFNIPSPFTQTAEVNHQSQLSHESTTHLVDTGVESDDTLRTNNDKNLDIEQRQVRLQRDLKDIYNQIKNVLPPAQSIEKDRNTNTNSVNSSLSGNNHNSDNGKKHPENSYDLATERKLREEIRPWRATENRSSNRKATAPELGLKLLSSTE